jgi:hypothetical protein
MTSNSNGKTAQPTGLVGLYFLSFNGEVVDGAGQVRADLGDGWYLLARVERCWSDNDELVGEVDLNDLENAYLTIEHLKEMSSFAWRFHASREAVEQVLAANQGREQEEQPAAE